MEPKSMKHWSKMGPDGDLERHGLREPTKSVPYRTVPHHFGAIWEPNGIKMATQILSKFIVDLEVHFWSEKESKWRSKGAEID